MPAARTLRTRAAVAAPAVAALILGTLAAATPAGAATPVNEQAAKELPGSHPAWATAQADAGAVADSTQSTARVYLAGQNSAGLAALAKAVSDVNSPDYGKFLSADEAKTKFGATPAQVKAVTAWLTGAGLKVTDQTAHYVEVSGTTGQLAKAFGAPIHSYRTADGTHRAPARDVVVPAALAGSVLGVANLTDVQHKAVSQAVSVKDAEQAGAQSRAAAAPEAAKPDAGLPTVPTCSDNGYASKIAKGAPAGYEKNEPFAPCSYTPTQLRKAYGISDAKVTGKGARIAIIDAYALGTMEQDANHFAQLHGDKPFAKGQYSEVVTKDKWNHQSDCGDWSGEEALDVEMAHGLAPDAKVVYVGADSCLDGDLNAALAKVVDGHLADIVSNSWGEIMHGKSGDLDPAVIAADNQLFELGAVEGISFTVSSGDCGNDSPQAAATGINCEKETNQAQAQWPSSSPWVTSVGGTALELADKTGKYGHEVSMGDVRSVLSDDGKSWTPKPGTGTFYFGGGGGVSKDFQQPWYQKGVVPKSVSMTAADGTKSLTPLRATPDVAMSGDLVAATLVGYTDKGTYSEGGYGGTSVSAPEYAAILADTIQERGGRAIGFANPAIYDRAGTKAFHDVNDAAVRTPRGNVVDLGMVGGSLKVRLYKIGADYGLTAKKGYDTATGVGTPNGADYFKSFKLPRKN
ncbi:S53 family peptidase [Kitasatospora sp. NPDC001175]|uniref:S53 family peptidase n=1 Tax=Kitasatospora sp. NPDC001175 TaxID=3157103 RepID=UPI003D049B51